jgi:hypothetical protein
MCFADFLSLDKPRGDGRFQVAQKQSHSGKKNQPGIPGWNLAHGRLISDVSTWIGR